MKPLKKEEIITICMFCQRIKITNELWVSKADISYIPKPHISHGLCPECAEKYYAKLYPED